MAGHNKWKQIKVKKGIADKKRSTLFSKLLKAITIAAKDGEKPEFNPRLKAAIERAKESNVPQENIERAIKKVRDKAENFEEMLIEAYGPGGTALVIEAITDSKNRTVQEVKNILKDGGGRLAEPKSVIWAFEKESGAWHAKFPGNFSEEDRVRTKELMTNLEENEDVQSVYHNLSQ